MVLYYTRLIESVVVLHLLVLSCVQRVTVTARLLQNYSKWSETSLRNNLVSIYPQTSYTVLWLLYCLAKNPDVQERLFQEVDPLLSKDNFLSADDLSKIPYLKACLKESQR